MVRQCGNICKARGEHTREVVALDEASPVYDGAESMLVVRLSLFSLPLEPPLGWSFWACKAVDVVLRGRVVDNMSTEVERRVCRVEERSIMEPVNDTIVTSVGGISIR